MSDIKCCDPYGFGWSEPSTLSRWWKHAGIEMIKFGHYSSRKLMSVV